MITKCIVGALTEVLKLKSSILYKHSTEVARVAESLCQTLNLNGEIIAAIRDAGYLHDLGKLGVRDAILQKPGDLSEREWEQVKLHPVLSVEILKNLGGVDHRTVNAIMYHHESADGSGYFGLKEDRIPLEAKILRVADVFSAMTMDRPYKVAYPVKISATYCSGLFDFGVDRTTIQETLINSKKGSE